LTMGSMNNKVIKTAAIEKAKRLGYKGA